MRSSRSSNRFANCEPARPRARCSHAEPARHRARSRALIFGVHRRGRLGSLCAAALLSAFSAARVCAQDALGDGRGLDNNLQTEGGGVNPGANHPDYNARNNLITGNTSGLQRFHGNVGYSAPGEFQSRLGSDSLYQFHTRSLPAGQPSNWSQDLGDDQPVYRSFAPISIGDITSRRANALVPRDAGHAGNSFYSLPETGIGVGDDAVNRLDARRYDGAGLQLEASPLLGLRLKPRGGNDIDIHVQGATPLGAELQPDALDLERSGGPAQSLTQRLGALDQRLKTADQPSADNDVYLDLLMKIRQNRAVEGPPASAPTPLGTPAAPGGLRAPSIENFAKLIDYNAPPIATLAGRGTDPINEKLRAAEAHLQAGRYYDADRDYRDVLELQPGHPMARVGLIHAELGAGMILTAGHNLHELFARHPELIAARYQKQLLPDAQRLEWAQKQIVAMMQRDDRRVEPALLLAYLHYQHGELQPMRDALDAAHTRAPDDQLPSILRMVWDRKSNKGAP